MSALAKILAQKGLKVSGCDIQPNFMTKQDLEQNGVRVYLGHDPCHLKGVDFVVYSSAIKPENEEFRAALQQGIPVLHRSEILSDLMDEEYSIAVTGTHGKSSTTGFIAQGLKLLGLEPTYIGGAVVNALGGNANLGTGPVVGEVDESDGSLLRIPASLKVVLNLDNDHLPFYGTMENLASTMEKFIAGQPHDSMALLNSDDPFLKDINQRSRRVHWYGCSSVEFTLESVSLKGVNPQVELQYGSNRFSILNKKIFGKQNGWNLGMAFAAMVLSGVDPKMAAEALENVETPRRRQQILGKVGRTSIMVDIALHPTELRVLRDTFDHSGARVLLVFQPHRYSRYKLLFEQFAEELSNWNDVVVTEIYKSDEPEENVSSYPLYQKITSKNKFFYPNKETLFAKLPDILPNYDVVLFAGLGSIGNWAEEFFSKLS
jgi:UDP-N-acetylmuramate--alanine ligase